MKAFDSDILKLFSRGDPVCVLKAALIPAAERAIPIIVAEEVLRGRLDAIRHAQAGKSSLSVGDAYERFKSSIADFGFLKILSHSPQAEALVQVWRKQKIKVGISDLRIAAICIVHSAKLISRNRRDFDQVPGLLVEYW